MNSRRNNNSSKARLGFFALALVVAIFFATEYFSQGAIRNGARDVAAAVWSTSRNAYDTTEASGFFQSKVSLARENQELKKEREELLTMQFQNDVLRAENASLRAFLNAHEAHPNGKVASVLSRPGVSPYDTFVIGIGSEDGVVPGDVVLVAAGLVLGEVKETGTRTSLVSLYSAPGYTRDVLLRDALLTYTGRGSGGGVVQAPRDLEVQAGDLLYLPDSAFALGVVGHVAAKPEDAYHEVLVSPPTNLSALRFVEVVHASDGAVLPEE
ncbi:MAG: rod shape-determining protein MreC [Candidatus Pacebacteria bacterium]|nr:rod shape-determining protein MreC [Candidatus Paceibacterota bacterium]